MAAILFFRNTLCNSASHLNVNSIHCGNVVVQIVDSHCSDVVVQIVDARNPLLFRCTDLEEYVQEVDQNKLNMILINKADYLSQEQRYRTTGQWGGEGIALRCDFEL